MPCLSPVTDVVPLAAFCACFALPVMSAAGSLRQEMQREELSVCNLETCKHFTFFGRISLEIMTLQPRCEDVETAEGVAITVTGVAQVQ